MNAPINHEFTILASDVPHLHAWGLSFEQIAQLLFADTTAEHIAEVEAMHSQWLDYMKKGNSK